MNRQPAALLVAFVWFHSTAHADWPDYRGPTGQGHYKGKPLPTKWGPMTNVTWKQEIPGKGWSSPVVHDGKIYLTTAVPVEGSEDNDQSLLALCVDATTGKVLWRKEVFLQDGSTAPRVHSKNSHASPSPLTDGKRIYVHFGHQGTAALSLTGEVLWQNRDLTYRPVHGNGGSPILVDDLLVFSCDGSDKQFIVALEVQTGKVRWKTDRKTDAFKKFSFGTPVLIEVKGKKQIISTGSNVVSAYDPATGKEIWRVNYDGYSLVPRPVYEHGLLFVFTGFDSPNLLAIRPDGEGDITETNVAWTVKQRVPLTPSPLVVGDEIYLFADRGIASCLDAQTGKVHWNDRLTGNFSSSPLHADGKIYISSEEGTTYVLKAGTQFEVLAQNRMDERIFSSLAPVDGVIFLRTEKHLYRIEQR